MKNIKLFTMFLSVLTFFACGKQDDINPESNAPQGPKMVLTKAANVSNGWQLLIDAAEADRADIWIDLNNNGTKDEGEAVTKFAVMENYSFASQTIALYGKITGLHCNSNGLVALDVSKNTALKILRCINNALTTLDLSKNIALTELNCLFNQLTALDVSKNTALKQLNCSNNQLTALTLPSNLTEFAELILYLNKLNTNEMSNIIRDLPDRTGKEQGYVHTGIGLGETNAMPSLSSQAVAVGRNWLLIFDE